MIEKMKKLTFLVTEKEYDGFIAGLREQGVVHVQQLRAGRTSPALQQALDLRTRYQQALSYLDISLKAWEKEEQGAGSKEQENSKTKQQGSVLLDYVEQLKAEEVSLRHEIDEAEKNAERMEPWGNFEWESIHRVQQETGMKVWFYACAAKSFQPDWAEKYFAIPIDDYRKRTYFLAFSDEEPDIKAERLAWNCPKARSASTGSRRQRQGRLSRRTTMPSAPSPASAATPSSEACSRPRARYSSGKWSSRTKR